MMLTEDADPQSFVAEAADRDAKEMIVDPALFCSGCFKRTMIGDVEYFADQIARFAGLAADVAMGIAALRFQVVELTATVPPEEVPQPLRLLSRLCSQDRNQRRHAAPSDQLRFSGVGRARSGLGVAGVR
jgi:hypothetical protein